ncbi:MAG: hypothetical protein KF751_10005 [Nitrospira sp.]|nr:hypothetical protein [Nitrospira sp.]
MQIVKTWALRDDPDVRRVRDILYLLFMDEMAVHPYQGVPPNGEKCLALSDSKRKQLQKEHEKLREIIKQRYRVDKWNSGNIFFVRKKNWLETLVAVLPSPMTVDTNFRRAGDIVRLRFVRLPKGAKRVGRARRDPLYSISPLQAQPIDEPPLLKVQVDLSRINQHDLERLSDEFKQQIKTHLKELSSALKKLPSPLMKNLKRDYNRYHQHYRDGKTYAQIAQMERIRNNGSIQYSVEQMHLAIHGDIPPNARSRRQELKSRQVKHKLSTYDCPAHGTACTRSCPYYKDFQADLDSSTYQF